MSRKQSSIGYLARGFAEAALGCIVLGLVAAGMAGAGQTPSRPESPGATAALGQPDAAAQAVKPAVPAAATFPVTATPGSDRAVAAATIEAPAAAKAVPEPDDADGTAGLKPAKLLFGTTREPAPLAARAIGTYARGCLSGAKALPVDGPQWQAMRLSRNRNWGHPKLIAMVQKLAADGKAKDGWPGLLVGDLSQPRGGPMLTGHASHQIGLDADIWLTPMPDRRLTEAERETLEATSMLAVDAVTIAREKWTDGHFKIIKRAASYPEVERILVHPAIKQVLCFAANGDRGWLHKVRPYWGHHYHFHVRMACPAGSASCVPQGATPGDDGCGKELDDWLKRVDTAHSQPPIPVPPAQAPKEKPPITLDQLPTECRVVLATGNPGVKADVAAAALSALKLEAKAKDKANKDKASKDRAKAGSERAVAASHPRAEPASGQQPGGSPGAGHAVAPPSEQASGPPAAADEQSGKTPSEPSVDGTGTGPNGSAAGSKTTAAP